VEKDGETMKLTRSARMNGADAARIDEVNGADAARMNGAAGREVRAVRRFCGMRRSAEA